MSEMQSDRLYQLLPTVYRLRDRAQGDPLRALLSVLESELQILEDDIDSLYNNWFIETCDEWVVPYIGDLLGVRGLIPLEGSTFSQRAMVANTLAYRRRKGTASVLEQLARDVTGWPAKAVEFFQRLSTHQYLNHVRSNNLVTLDLRQNNFLELVNGPFESALHTIDVRHIDNRRGQYNIPNIGLFLWRLQSYFISDTEARSTSFTGCYTFNSLGISTTLFNRPRTETEVTQLATEANVTIPLRRRPLFDELAALRQSQADSRNRIYFSDQPVFRVFTAGHEIPLKQMFICDLEVTDSSGNWYRPLPAQTGQSAAEVSTLPAAIRDLRVGVDPTLGRIVMAHKVSPTQVVPYTEKVEVSYAYGFPGDLGGGPYNRRASVATWYEPQKQIVDWQIGVTQDEIERNKTPEQLVATLTTAIERWNTYSHANPNTFGLIVLMDNHLYNLATTGVGVPNIRLPAGSRLAIVAADWIAVDVPEDALRKQRIAGSLVPSRKRAHVLGDLTVHGTASADALNPGQLILDGVLLEGTFTVNPGNLEELNISHSTLLNGLIATAQPTAGEQNERLSISLTRSIVQSVTLAATVPALQVKDSLLEADKSSGVAITAPGATTDIETSTILGTVQVRSIEASNSIFTQTVTSILRQTGCVRFSYVPLGSLVPRRFHCHPIDADTAQRIVPQFTSLTYGQPNYGQLAPDCPIEILAGAEDEGEMGAFHFLQQTQRMKNFQTRLTEYLPFGLEAGIFLRN